MPKILMEADDLQPGTAHTILRESVLSHMLTLYFSAST